MIKAVCLISGKGTNLEAILKHIDKNNLNLNISFVISDNPKAKGLSIAENYNINTHVIDFQKYKNKKDFDDQL